MSIKQKKLDETFLNIARELSKLSHCVSFKVACVLVKDNRVISSGINGSIIGGKNCDEIFSPFSKDSPTREEHRNWSLKNEIHAEANAIIFAAKNGVSVQGSTCYSTLQPCGLCLLFLAQSGIKRVVYSDPYDKSVYCDDIDVILKNMAIEKQ